MYIYLFCLEDRSGHSWQCSEVTPDEAGAKEWKAGQPRAGQAPYPLYYFTAPTKCDLCVKTGAILFECCIYVCFGVLIYVFEKHMHLRTVFRSIWGAAARAWRSVSV